MRASRGNTLAAVSVLFAHAYAQEHTEKIYMLSAALLLEVLHL